MNSFRMMPALGIVMACHNDVTTDTSARALGCPGAAEDAEVVASSGKFPVLEIVGQPRTFDEVCPVNMRTGTADEDCLLPLVERHELITSHREVSWVLHGYRPLTVLVDYAADIFAEDSDVSTRDKLSGFASVGLFAGDCRDELSGALIANTEISEGLPASQLHYETNLRDEKIVYDFDLDGQWDEIQTDLWYWGSYAYVPEGQATPFDNPNGVSTANIFGSERNGYLDYPERPNPCWYQHDVLWINSAYYYKDLDSSCTGTDGNYYEVFYAMAMQRAFNRAILDDAGLLLEAGLDITLPAQGETIGRALLYYDE